MSLLAPFYLWIKAFHIVAVIAWMAGLLYLPRLFVYHADAAVGSAMSETFKVMEAKLYRMIIRPAMWASIVFGGLLISLPGVVDWHHGWMHAKLVLVLGLLVFTHFLAHWRRAFLEDRNTRPARFFRMVNEIPTLLMIAIVVLVVVKPF